MTEEMVDAAYRAWDRCESPNKLIAMRNALRAALKAQPTTPEPTPAEVEMVARAISKAGGFNPDAEYDDGNLNWHMSVEEARAAIAAMREGM